MRRSIVISVVVLIALGGLPGSAGGQSSAAQRCFPETGQCVEGRFLDYWNAHGGLAINGFPLTAERVETLEDGQQYTVQWFERVRMEYHPENAAPNDVLLGQFGRIIHPADPPVAPIAGAQHFPQTGHNVPPDFLAFWNANGGLPQFGYPISEVIRERLGNGEYEVQYFERARFERHPENAAPNQILLGQFGRQILAAPWGPTLAPLANNYFTYDNPGGRYSTRIPNAWNQRQDAAPNSVLFRQPGPLWGAEIAFLDTGFTDITQVDPVINEQVSQRPNYRPINLDKVNIGPHKAYRRIFQHTNDEGQTEIIFRIYFLVGSRMYTVNGFVLPGDRGTVEPLVDGIAGSMQINP